MKSTLPSAVCVLTLSVLTACHYRQELALAPIAPVLSGQFEIDNTSRQMKEFSFGEQGEYLLRFSTSLRNGPGSSPETHFLPIHVEILDADGGVRYEESLEVEMGPNQVGGTIAAFDSKVVAGKNPHQFVLTLKASQAFSATYQDLHMSLARKPKAPLLF